MTHTTSIISQEGILDHADNFIRQSSNELHVRLPWKNEKNKYQIFADKVDDLIKTNEHYKLIITNDKTFLKLYSGLSTTIMTTAAKVFEKPKLYTKRKETIMNCLIQSVVSNICHIGGAIQFEKSDGVTHVSLKAMKHHSDVLENLSPSNSILYLLTKSRKTLHILLFSECAKEIIARAKLSDNQKITAALMANSTRINYFQKLYD